MSPLKQHAVEAGSLWCDKGESPRYVVRVLRVQRNGRIAFERVVGGPLGKEVRCDREQFLAAFRPQRGRREKAMSDAQLMLRQFHALLGDEPGRGNAQLRITLHGEEHAELIEALYALHYSHVFGRSGPTRDGGRREALARELADVVYVAYGTAHAFGIDLDVALAEIHRAAMSKLDPATMRVRDDGKVLKPEGFVPPDMSRAIGGEA